MEIVELIIEVAPVVLSILATIVAFIKGKTKITKSVEEIKAEADKLYAAYVEKQCKKNGIQNVQITSSEEVVSGETKES